MKNSIQKVVSTVILAAIFSFNSSGLINKVYGSGLYFAQLDKSTMDGTDIGSVHWKEQKVKCSDFDGVINEITTNITTSYHSMGSISYEMKIKGLGYDTFSQTSDVLTGVLGVNNDYTFTFSPSVDVGSSSTLCNTNSNFTIALRQVSGSYVSGKVYGSGSHSAYRDNDYKCYNCSLVADMYLVVNPDNYVPPLFLKQSDYSALDGTDLNVNWKEQKIACEDVDGVIEETVMKIQTSTASPGDINYQMRIRGFSSDSFSQVSNVVAGTQGTSQDYTFAFSPNINVATSTTLCNASEYLILGISQYSGSYLSGKVYGSESSTAYRDSDHECYGCGILEDLYFVINPDNE